MSLTQVVDPSTSALDTESGPNLAPSSCWQAGMGTARPLAPGGNRAGGAPRHLRHPRPAGCVWAAPLPARPITHEFHAHNVTATLPPFPPHPMICLQRTARSSIVAAAGRSS